MLYITDTQTSGCLLRGVMMCRGYSTYNDVEDHGNSSPNVEFGKKSSSASWMMCGERCVGRGCQRSRIATQRWCKDTCTTSLVFSVTEDLLCSLNFAVLACLLGLLS
jgi:hypothetical protein